MKRPLLVGLAVVAALAAGAAVFQATRPKGPPPLAHPNVLIVLWDTVRADHLSVYGHPVDTTPNLKAFAEQGVVYENAVSPGMWTVPSHGSIFTGLAPTTHGASFEWRWLDQHHVTLAEHFQQNGYDTFAFSANPNLSKRGANLLQGFGTIETSWREWWPLVRKATRMKLLPDDASTEISPAFEGKRPGNAYYNGAPATGRALFRWLDKGHDPQKPFLAYLNYMEAHKPRVPGKEHRDPVMDEARQQLALKTDVTFVNQLAYGYGAVEFTGDEIEATRSVYDACLHELDDWTNRLFSNLEKRGVLDDTIVVVTSDHGESLGEHRRYGHRFGMYQTLLHVPLIIRYPKKLQPARVAQPVTTQDLFATLTDLAELPPAPTATDSKSLLGTLRPALFSEVLSFDSAGLDLVRSFYPQIPAEGWENTFRAIRSANLKLIVDAHDHAELYDIETDPLETADLAEARPDEVATLRSAMEAHWASLPAYDPSKRAESDHPVFTKKEKSMLEVLGYVVDDEEGKEGVDDEAVEDPPEGGPALDDGPEIQPD
ncbi:MAG: sulfatase [Alphaproteobacteria bacterium]|nr:sulfatase [Alphaproteobacteria bacterium]